jgi:hypothetical protein
LLDREASVGFSVLEALTPHPVGDIKIEDFESTTSPSNSILWGGVPGVYFTENTTDEEFENHVKHVLTIMKNNPRFVLGVADQVPPDGLESRVRQVGELVEQYGTYD